MSDSSNAFFNDRLLSRATISDADAARFREESRARIMIDPETQARVICYVHPDGRILIDAVHIP